jgi:predicted CXXCH cytochrome family protein
VFSHSKHANRNVKIEGACAACHSVKEDGVVEAPNHGKNHQPCAAAGCHQTEFMSKTVKICGVCHDKAAPWEKALARMHESSPARPQEFFENINHKTHLQKKGTTNAACNDCHGDKLGGGKAPKGHQACIECHGKGPPAHAMSECGKCHQRDAVARAGTSEWSVAATFVHQRHANDSRSRKTTNCAECHAAIGASTSLANMAKPKMEVCAGCHDGKVSFKTTGFDCSKCHTKAKQPSTPTAGGGFTTSPGDQAGLLDTRSVGGGSPAVGGLLSFAELQVSGRR